MHTVNTPNDNNSKYENNMTGNMKIIWHVQIIWKSCDGTCENNMKSIWKHMNIICKSCEINVKIMCAARAGPKLGPGPGPTFARARVRAQRKFWARARAWAQFHIISHFFIWVAYFFILFHIISYMCIQFSHFPSHYVHII